MVALSGDVHRHLAKPPERVRVPAAQASRVLVRSAIRRPLVGRARKYPRLNLSTLKDISGPWCWDANRHPVALPAGPRPPRCPSGSRSVQTRRVRC